MSLRPSRNKDHPPLDADFFGKARALAGSHPKVKDELDRLLQRLKDDGHFASPVAPTWAPLEQFFADVYYEVASLRRQSAFDVLVALIRLYAQVLAETTNWMAIHQGLGALDHLLRIETQRSASDQLTVITFNQDLLIENVAQRMPRQAGRWCLASLYGDLPLSPLYATDKEVPVFEHHRQACVHNPPFELLKLHGSLNWGLTSVTENPSMSTVFPRSQRRTVHMLNRRRVLMGYHMRSRTSRGRQRWHLWPLIIPPIYDKQRVMGMAILQSLWDKAAHSIATAESILLVGYSLPESDISARQLLRRSFVSNANLHRITLINPDPLVVPKVQRILGVRVIRVYADVASYLADHQ